jgi:hypothetical protein
LAGEFLLDGRYVDDILMAHDLLQNQPAHSTQISHLPFS